MHHFEYRYMRENAFIYNKDQKTYGSNYYQ